MLSLPSSRRYLVPALVLFALVLFIRTIRHREPPSTRALLTTILNSNVQHGVPISAEEVWKHLLPFHNESSSPFPPTEHYFTLDASPRRPEENSHFASLLTCAPTPNIHTRHIRLPNLVYNITHLAPDSVKPNSNLQLFNPTILALPPWSPHHYLLVSRVVTEGLHQESLICFADICHHPNSTRNLNADSKPCTASSLLALGNAGGLQCMTPPTVLSIPPTPALHCDGAWSAFPSIPGFHDPRIFWSGKGEPLIIVNSASQYACVGLWMVDLRVLEPSLKLLLERQGSGKTGKGTGPLISYPSLTELTRNPAADRAAIEKNWLLFFGSGSGVSGDDYSVDAGDEAFVHYDMFGHNFSHDNISSGMSGGRSFAKLIGNGFTTENLTDQLEAPCLTDEDHGQGQRGHWHQASNALKLILCTRADVRRGQCNEHQEGRVVNFAVVHRKFSNDWKLPLRYERYFVVWDARKPFHMVGVSRYPVLFWNETASGWSGKNNWAVELSERAGVKQQGWNGTISIRDEARMGNTTRYEREGVGGNVGKNWAYFTYTPSIAWVWRPMSQGLKHGRGERDGEKEDYLRSMHVGYLDDEVVVGIGLDDHAQAFAKAKAKELLSCMRLCQEKTE